MKKIFYFLITVVATCLFGNVALAQTPTTLPYDCNGFKDKSDWTLLNDGPNGWYIDTPAGESETKLYISSGDGKTAGVYEDVNTRVLALREFKDVPTDVEMLTVSFDVECQGESTYDYLKVFLLASGGDSPDLSEDLVAVSDDYTYNYFPYDAGSRSYTGIFNGNFHISDYSGKVYMQIARPYVSTSTTNPSKNITLAFVWINDYSTNYQGAIISNVKVSVTPEDEIITHPPRRFSFHPLSKTEAMISWDVGNEGDAWKVKLGENGIEEELPNPGFTAKNLEKGKKYTVFAQEKKNGRWSEWVSFEFTFDYNPGSYFLDVIHSKSTEVTLKGRYGSFDFYKPKDLGFAYRLSADKNAAFTKVKADSVNTEDNVFMATIKGLSPNTYYDVTTFVVNADDEEIVSERRIRNFVTPIKQAPKPSTLPYVASMDDDDDEWLFANGEFGWYKDKDSKTLFLSDNGSDKSFSMPNVSSNIFAYKSVVVGKSPYITVEFDAHIGGHTTFDPMQLMGLNIVTYSGAFTEDDEVFRFSNRWYFNGQELISNYDGKVKITLPVNISNPEDDQVFTIGFWWMQTITALPTNDSLHSLVRGIYDAIEDGFDSQVTISNLTIKAENDDFFFAYTPTNIYYDYYENDLIVHLNEAYLSQVRLDNGAVISLDLHNEDEGNPDYTKIIFENIPFGEHTVYARNRFVKAPGDTVYSDWISQKIIVSEFRRGDFPLILQKKPVVENTTAKIDGYVVAQGSASIVSLGVEYKKVTDQQWTDSPCESSDMTLYSREDVSKISSLLKGSALDFAMAEVSKTLTDLSNNTEYETRIYAELSDGVRVYSDVQKFLISVVGLQNMDNNVQIAVYPNPAKEYINLLVDGLAEKSQIHIIDMQGRVLSTQTLANNDKLVKINTSNLATGVYYITVQNQKQRFVEKLVIK